MAGRHKSKNKKNFFFFKRHGNKIRCVNRRIHFGGGRCKRPIFLLSKTRCRHFFFFCFYSAVVFKLELSQCHCITSNSAVSLGSFSSSSLSPPFSLFLCISFYLFPSFFLIHFLFPSLQTAIH